MGNKNVLDHYKSGINKIKAASNPFADPCSEADDNACDDAVGQAARVRSRIPVYAAAAAAMICVAVGTFIVIRNTDSFGAASSSDTASLAPSVASSDDSNTDNNSIAVSSSQGSSAINSDTETSQNSSHIYSNTVIDAETKKLIEEYSKAEDEKQKILIELSTRTDSQVSYSDVETKKTELKKQVDLQDTIIKKLLAKKSSLPDVLLIGIRRINDQSGTLARLEVLDLETKNVTVSGFLTINMRDSKVYTYSAAKLTGKITEGQVQYLTVDLKSAPNYDSLINSLPDIFSLSASIQVNDGENTTSIECDLPFSSQPAVNENTEKDLLNWYTGKNNWDSLTVIGT